MKKALFIILAIAAFDSIGMGLVVPILPGLFKHLGTPHVAQHYGFFLSLYAFFQLIFSPILGRLSDRFGRKPVLLLSILGSAIDYLMMAMAHHVFLLYVGRVIAGITGANMAVASSMLADLTPPEERTRSYGWLHAAFGIGFTVGPALGGWMADFFLHAPFVMAAILAALNFFLVLFALPESHQNTPSSSKGFLPLLTVWRHFTFLIPLLGVYAVLELAAQAPNALWALYTQTQLGWHFSTIGLSYTAFGVTISLARAFLTGPLSRAFSEGKTLYAVLGVEIVVYILLSFVVKTWVIFAMIPLFALGSLWEPILQSIASTKVTANDQGMLQGAIITLAALASMIAPIMTTQTYVLTKTFFPGFAWLMVAILYAVGFLFFGRAHRSSLTRTMNKI